MIQNWMSSQTSVQVAIGIKIFRSRRNRAILSVRNAPAWEADISANAGADPMTLAFPMALAPWWWIVGSAKETKQMKIAWWIIFPVWLVDTLLIFCLWLVEKMSCFDWWMCTVNVDMGLVHGQAKRTNESSASALWSTNQIPEHSILLLLRRS